MRLDPCAGVIGPKATVIVALRNHRSNDPHLALETATSEFRVRDKDCQFDIFRHMDANPIHGGAYNLTDWDFASVEVYGGIDAHQAPPGKGHPISLADGQGSSLYRATS